MSSCRKLSLGVACVCFWLVGQRSQQPDIWTWVQPLTAMPSVIQAPPEAQPSLTQREAATSAYLVQIPADGPGAVGRLL